MECGKDMVSYLDSLSKQYPEMKQWSIHPWRSILAMAREGNLAAIQGIQCICKCITSDGWQKIGEIASRYGRLDILWWIKDQGDIDWTRIASIARSQGYKEIALYSDGYSQILDLAVTDYEPWPLNIGPEGEPMADKGKSTLDWRMEDYKEDMLPEEMIPLGEGEDDNPLSTVSYPLGQYGYGFEGYIPEEDPLYDRDDDREDSDTRPDDEM